jgi:Ca2+-binding EF-hand superfamily protein
VDLDGSGTIEFNEFLEIMSNIKRGKQSENSKNSAIVDFFKSKTTLTQSSAVAIWNSLTSP